jgi:hypothetical protein
LRSAYRRPVDPPDRNEVSAFRTCELRPVSGGLSTPGSWCSRGQMKYSSRHRRFPAADPIRRCHLPPPALDVTRLPSRLHRIRLSGLPLARSQWMGHRPLGFPPGFTPHAWYVHTRRMPEARTGLSTSPETNRRPCRPSNRSVHSQCATSRRTSQRPSPQPPHAAGPAAHAAPSPGQADRAHRTQA